MRHKLFSASCMMAIAVIGAAPAYADNLHGFSCGTGTSTSAPGNSATSPGSTHNEPITAIPNTVSVNGGTGGAAYNSARQNNPKGPAAPSNYDTSCHNVTQHGTGTPIQQSPSASSTPQVPNNSLATRTMTEQVTSHSTVVHNR